MAHFPGFDIGSYPGDNAITAWAKAGKYKWCGYYLNSPCHSAGTFAPFTGKAAFLHSLGLGLAIIYVGFQQEGCGSTQLTNQRGILHGMDAVAKCQSEGFPNQAIIFLDVEFFNGSITAAFAEYYRGWLSAVLASQLFQPGTYVAAANFSDIYLAAQQEYAAYRLSSAGPAIWIALEDTSFDPVNDGPTDSGIAQANVWQGLLDVQQSQGGIALTVDLDTADSPDPSQSRVTPTIVIIDYTLSQ
jgi:hypothetical protein